MVHRLIFLCISLFIICLSCTFACNSDEQYILDAAMEPVPIDKDANDWYADQEGIQFFSSMISEHPNGLGVMVQTLYKHKYDDYHSTFFVEEEFIAEISIASGLPETKPFAIICLLDYQQIPCHPDLPKEYILEISKDSFPSTRIPIHITDLQPGLHDLNVVIVRNPYEEGIDAIGENIRYSILTTVGSYNLLKDGVVESANTIKPIRVEPEGRLDRPAILDVSTNPQLVNELGNIPLWIDAQGKVGEILPFFLHFNSDVYDEQGDTIAVTAFLNYEQVPLLYEGEEYLSFYVVREADSWQRASVSIQLPYEPGIYELFVVARTDAFSPLEIEHSERDLVGSETSKRIRIEVIP